MERYWIRNRGRTQGPLTLERIQGLMRRGRFNRHFYVSVDKKEWLPASDFPELFEGVVPSRGGRGGRGDDEEVFQGGGSPFESDYDEPPARTPARGRSPFDDDEDDDEEWEDDDDGEWEDDYQGSSGGLVGWVEKNAVPVLAVLVVLLGGVSWFVFFRESFAQDEADLEALITVNQRITTAHTAGASGNEWAQMSESVEDELSSMVSRLMTTASVNDQLRQELLFCARDDVPRMMRELPTGRDDAQKRLQLRLSRIDRMIKDKERIHDGEPLGGAPATQLPPKARQMGTDSDEGADAMPDTPGGGGQSGNIDGGNSGSEKMMDDPDVSLQSASPDSASVRVSRRPAMVSIN